MREEWKELAELVEEKGLPYRVAEHDCRGVIES